MRLTEGNGGGVWQSIAKAGSVETETTEIS